MSKNALKIDNEKSPVGGIDINIEEGLLFCCGLSSSLIYHYRIEDVNDPVNQIKTLTIQASYISQVATFRGAPNPTVTKYNSLRKELYVGHKHGVLSVYQIETLQNGPVCKKF